MIPFTSDISSRGVISKLSTVYSHPLYQSLYISLLSFNEHLEKGYIDR